ncbi:MAG: SDR family oxidoreductase [Bacteroidota bacterium]
MPSLALITGASSGIGADLARIHAERGGDLILLARREDKLTALASELESAHGITAHVLAKDLTDENAAQEVYDEVIARGLTVDLLINNAGFGGVGRFHEREWSTDRAMIQLNVVALVALCRLFLPDMVARGRGRILNNSSTASLLPGPMQAVYFATKAFVTSFGNAIAEELRGTGVTVTTLMPGATETEFGQRSGMDKTDLFQEAATSRSVAEDGYRAMMAGELDVISGLSLKQRVAMAAVPFTPKSVLLKQVHAMQQPKDA